MPNSLILLESLRTQTRLICWNKSGHNRRDVRGGNDIGVSKMNEPQGFLFQACLFARALMLAGVFASTGFLTGCFEGKPYYRGARSTHERGQDGSQVSDTKYFDANDEMFIRPLGYPSTGEFAGDVARVEVKTEAEMIQAVRDQKGTMVLTVTGPIELHSTIRVDHPIIIQTRNEIGSPEARLSFVKSATDASATGGVLVVDRKDYTNIALKCEKLNDGGVLKSQMYVMLKGAIRGIHVELRSSTHLVIDTTDDGSFSPPRIRSSNASSTIFIRGVDDQSIDVSYGEAPLGRFVFGKGTKFNFNAMSTALGDSPMLPLNLGGLDYSTSILQFSNICFSADQILRATTYESYNHAYYANRNETNCRQNGWFLEAETRSGCVATAGAK